jgi:protein-S-isoprenylcysteine O-methyltransferase Ste14
VGLTERAPVSQILLIIAATFVLAWVSRRSLRAPGSHGFYRFFAWEAIVLQIVLNLPYWFEAPFSPIQVISWILLFASLYPVAAAVVELRRRGEAVPAAPGDANYSFENTTRLVTGGIYRRIRHPMYSSLLLLAWGAFFKHISAEGLLATVLASVFLFFTASIEEEENARKFGAAYTAYMRTTGMFLPPVGSRRRHGIT